MLGILRCVLFAPEDLAIVKGDPAERRRYLDDLLVASRPRYAAVRADYERVVKQRSALLKSARAAGRGDPAGLWTSGTSSWSRTAPSCTAGAAQADRRAPAARSRHRYGDVMRRTRAGASISYRQGSERSGRARPRTRAGQARPDACATALERLRRAELERGVCLVGPHRDELELRIGELPARGYASHGESWSLALALRLAAFGLLRADGEDPVLMLDDVFAELDAGRRERLAELAADAEQVLVTAAVPADVPARLAGTGYTVADGVIASAA